MYGSKSDKARISESDRSYARYVKQYNRRPVAEPDIDDQITAMVDTDEPAMLVDRKFSHIEIDRLHAEALKMHAAWYDDMVQQADLADHALADWETELLLDIPQGTSMAWSTLVEDVNDQIWEARMRLEEEDRRERDAAYDGAFGGYSSDMYEEDGYLVVDCWLPFMRLPELRETFGQNWLGNGFHIVQGNGIRRKQ